MGITKDLNIKNFLGVPIFTKDGDLYGNLCCFDTQFYSFTDDDVKLLQTMSTFLTYVIELESSKKNVESDFERLLHQSELILNSLSEGVFGVDITGNVSFCNPATTNLLNYTENELIGNNPLALFLQHVTESDSDILLTLNDGITRANSSESYYRKEGYKFPVEYTVNAIYENELIVGVVVTFIDITERKKSEDLILKSEKLSLAGQLAAGIAHEIRNPLTAIKGFLHLIQSGHQKDVYIQIMSEELSRIELILSELLMLAKPQEVNFKPVKIELLLADVISILDTQAILKNVEISFTVFASNLVINCDSNQFKQVFINLIKNAIEAIPNGGRIELGLEREKDFVVIYVKDNGQGIPEEKLQKLGQPFYSTKENGTGLGLMVSYNIIQNHQGFIDVYSKLNEGTTFTIKLPMHVEESLVTI
jgi:PAS domain S-box-containing protein